MTTLLKTAPISPAELFGYASVTHLDELMLIPASALFYECEAESCESRLTLTERKWLDEDGDAYYNVLCGPHRAQEVL